MKHLFIGGPANGEWREANHVTEPVLELQFSEVRDACDPPAPIPSPKVHVYRVRNIGFRGEMRTYFCLYGHEPNIPEVWRLIEVGPPRSIAR